MRSQTNGSPSLPNSHATTKNSGGEISRSERTPASTAWRSGRVEIRWVNSSSPKKLSSKAASRSAGASSVSPPTASTVGRAISSARVLSHLDRERRVPERSQLREPEVLREPRESSLPGDP